MFFFKIHWESIHKRRMSKEDYVVFYVNLSVLFHQICDMQRCWGCIWLLLSIYIGTPSLELVETDSVKFFFLHGKLHALDMCYGWLPSYRKLELRILLAQLHSTPLLETHTKGTIKAPLYIDRHWQFWNPKEWILVLLLCAVR